MRIIGKGEGGFLCIMKIEEIAKLAGHDSIYSDGWKEEIRSSNFRQDRHGHPDLVGGEISIDERWDRLNAIERRHKELTLVAAQMRGFADLLDKAMERPILKNPEPVF